MPAELSLPAAVVKAILAAGHAVQVEQDTDSMGIRGAKRPVNGIHRRDERGVFLGDSVVDREPDCIEPVRCHPLEIISSDPRLAMFLEVCGGLRFAELLA